MDAELRSYLPVLFQGNMRRAFFVAGLLGFYDCSATSIQSGAFDVELNTTTGAYTLSVDGTMWFTSGDTFYSDGQAKYSAHGGNLTAVGSSSDEGSDGAGRFVRVSVDWAPTTAAAAAAPTFRTSIAAYEGRSALVFRQLFLAASSGGGVGSRFPSLRAASAGLGAKLGTLEYSGSSCGFMVSAKAGFPSVSGGQSKGMIAIVPSMDEAALAGTALALGPVDEVFVNQASADQADGSLSYGAARTFTDLPAGYALETVLVASSRAHASPRGAAPERASIVPGGANAALAEYGDFVLARHGKARPAGNHTNEAATLGYSTTGYYFYNLCDCTDVMESPHKRTTCSAAGSAIPGCSSYQDTLEAVHDALVAQGVPYRSMLLDSWWYGENVYGGVSTWEDDGSVRNLTFPRGLAAFWEYIGKERSTWAHNGKWVASNPYAQQPQYPFTPDNELPQGDALWQHLFSANHEGWGLSTIKQDHMGENMGAVKTAYTNVSVLNSWLRGMARGASDNGVGVLYCCAPPSVHMFGATVQAAYAVRASPDYVWQANGRVLKLPQLQWALGPDNAFHFLANGLLPYKDTFFSNHSKAQLRPAGTARDQLPPFSGYYESDPSTHALMALLSMGPVTFADAVGAANKTLLMQTCRADGVLLKADRPATALDAQFHAMMFRQGWPGQPPQPSPPSPGHGALTAVACVAGAQDQQWAYDTATGALSAAVDAKHACVNIGKCDKSDGAKVQLFHNDAGCGTGAGTCKDQNELWDMQAATGGVRLVSRLAGKCLSASKAGAKVFTCSSAPGAGQVWTFSGGVLSQGGACLTGGAIAPLPEAVRAERPRLAALCGLDAPASLEQVSDGLSPAYASAARISARFVADLARRSLAEPDTCAPTAGHLRRADGTPVDEQCTVDKLTAPQGPLGEAYSTHTSVGARTWFYLVGVQIGRDLAVGPDQVIAASSEARAAGGESQSAAQGYVAVSWSDPSGFAPTARASVAPFDAAHPIVLSAHPSSGVGKRNESLYAAQYHLVAPVLANGWIMLGEAGKLVPVSRNRIASLVERADGVDVDVVGSEGEQVAFTFVDTAGAAADPVVVSCTLPAAGRARMSVPAGTCS